jgi:hypothetical protein
MPMLSARSITADAMAVDWAIRATRPGLVKLGATLALRPLPGTSRPPLAGPRTRTRLGRAASRMALCAADSSPGVIRSRIDGPAITARVPKAPSLAIIGATSASGVQMMASSGTTSRSSICTCAPRPNSERRLAVTGITGPAKPPSARLRSNTSA